MQIEKEAMALPLLMIGNLLPQVYLSIDTLKLEIIADCRSFINTNISYQGFLYASSNK